MTADVKIDLSEVVAWLELAEKAPDMTEQEAMVAMRAAVGMVDRQAKSRTPVNTGALANAWSTNVERGVSAVKGEIVNPLAYAIVVEKGRKASAKQPPIWPLVYWFRRKHGLPMDRAISAAWGLAKNLTQRDIKAVKMLEKGFEAAKPGIFRLFDAIPDKVFDRLA